MKTRLVAVVPSMAPRVHAALLREMNADIAFSRWERLFRWPWTNPEDHVGYALVEEGGRIVGFTGLVYSKQVVGGRAQEICNVTTWVVHDDYRSAGLSLLMPALRRQDLTITNLTATPVARDIFTRLGFRELETHTRVFLPLRPPAPNALRYRVTLGADAVERRLPAALQPLFLDHKPLGEHVWVEGPERSCYLLFTMGRTRGIATARIQFLSDATAFIEALPLVQLRLISRGIGLVESDDRFLEGLATPATRRIPLVVPRLYRSPTLAPRQISNLYSEMVLLEL